MEEEIKKEETSKKQKIINVIFWIICIFMFLSTIIIMPYSLFNLFTLLCGLCACPPFIRFLNKRCNNKIKNYMQIIGCIILFIICVSIEPAQNEIISTNTNEQITIGKLTYSIDNAWESKEDASEKVTYKYYYPTNNTMLMIMFSTGDNYGDSSSIDSFLDGYVSGMNLSNDNFINKSTKKINNYTCGIVKYYTYSNNDKYEVISYAIPNKNECYVFSFGQKDKLNNQNINIIENIIGKANIITETEEEKQARLQKEAEEKAQKEAEAKAEAERKAEEERQRQEQEAKQKEQEIQNFKNSCQTYTYKEIARNPDNYNGKNVKFTGEVIQVQEGYFSNSVTIRMNVTKGEYGFYEDTIYCDYTYSDGESKILEDDIITIYGTCKGDTSYVSVLGSTVTLPKVDVKYVTINQ